LNAINAFEEVLELITNKLNEHDQALLDIWNEDRDVIDREAASMADYHEGAVEALSIIKYQAQELFNSVK
jgi:hypothetical protein